MAPTGRDHHPRWFIPYGATPETVISAALKSHGPDPPFRIHVRIGCPIVSTEDPRADLENLRTAISAMLRIPSEFEPRLRGIGA